MFSRYADLTRPTKCLRANEGGKDVARQKELEHASPPGREIFDADLAIVDF